MRKVLNVGGNSKTIPLPSQYKGWENILLDIDPKGNPDIVCDARDLSRLPGSTFDAVYCSHNLEHYYRHDVPKVLGGFAHVLKANGFVHIIVPDMGEVMRMATENGMDIDDILYQSPAGPITVLDVMYGYGAQIANSGNEFYAHKTGFSRKSLPQMLMKCGFPQVFSGTGNIEVVAFGFKGNPDEFARTLLGLP